MEQLLRKVPGIPGSAARLATVLGAGPALTPGNQPSGIVSFLNKLRSEAQPEIKDGFGTLVGAAAGYYFGKKRHHPWLGAIAGASVGRNAPVIVTKPYDRRAAILNMAETGAGLFAVRMYPKHPVISFLAGMVGASALVTAAGWRR